MKTTINNLVLIALTPFLMLACSKKSSHNDSPAASAGTSTNSYIVTMRYFKGGFFAPPNAPNWSRDLTIDFTNYNNGYLVTSEHTDSLCMKADARLSTADTNDFLSLVQNLLLYVSTGPVMADAGVEYIEFTLQDGSKRRYHLLNAEVPKGEYYASNPADVRLFLRDLDDSLPVACQ